MSESRAASVLRARIAAAHGPAEASGAQPVPEPVPEPVLEVLCRYCLLEGVPLTYMLPDAGLLPDVSIRFFTVDPDWTDALAAGVLAVSAAGSSGQAFVARHLADTMAAVRARLASGAVESASAHTAGGPSESITGFLLRSALVSAYPQLEVRAFAAGANGKPPPGDGNPTDPSIAALKLPTLRLARLTPNVLIALFAGRPASIWIEEPHHGLRVGLQASDAQHPQPYVIAPGGHQVTVPFRGPDHRVIDVEALAGACGTGPGDLARVLLRLPVREVFVSSAQGGG